MRLGQGEGGGQLAGQEGPQPPFLLLVVGPDGQQLAVPRVRRLIAEDLRRRRCAAQDLVQQGQLDLAQSLTTELLVEMAGPESPVLHLLLQRCRGQLVALPAHLRLHQVERLDLGAHELTRPFELGLEGGIVAEVPGHTAPLLGDNAIRN